MKRKRMRVRIPDATVAKLDKLAQRLGRTRQQLLDEAIGGFFKDKNFQRRVLSAAARKP